MSKNTKKRLIIAAAVISLAVDVWALQHALKWKPKR